MNTTSGPKPNGLAPRPAALSSSVEVFWLDRPRILRRLRQTAIQLHRSHPEIERILLFGSLARGDAVPGSDADLLLQLAESDRPFLERSSLYRISDMGIGVDVVAYTRTELKEMCAAGNLFVAQALREGVVLWDAEGEQV